MNKYYFDIDGPIIGSEDVNRETRKKKHKQGRVLAWIFLVLFILCVGVGIFIGIKFAASYFKSANKPVDVVSTPENNVEPDDIISELIHNSEPEITPPEPIVSVPSDEELFEMHVREYIETMTLEEKVAGLFIVTPEQLTGVKKATKAGDGTKKALSEYAVGGIIYSSQNMTDQKQFKELVEGTKALSKYPLFIAVDEELGNSTFSKAMKVTSTMTISEIGAKEDASFAYVEEEKIAKYLSEYGINLNLGIVAEPNTGGDSSFMKKTTFSEDASVSGEMASRAVSALNEYGIFSGVKFFPGQSAANADPAKAISSTSRTRDDMLENEVAAFIQTIDAGATMVVVSHTTAEELSGESLPSSMSKGIMTDLLRVELGLDDVIIITDALTKYSITEYYDAPDVCIRALKAGADMILSPGDFVKSYEAVLEAVNTGVIAKERIDDSLVRIYKAKLGGTYMPEDEEGNEE